LLTNYSYTFNCKSDDQKVYEFNFNFPQQDIIQPIMHLNWTLPISITWDKTIVQNLLPLTVNIPSYFVLSAADNNLASISTGTVSQ